jgi:hypothetical protein
MRRLNEMPCERRETLVGKRVTNEVQAITTLTTRIIRKVQSEKMERKPPLTPSTVRETKN